MLWLIILFLSLYVYAGIWYAIGMSKYIENNYRKNKEQETPLAEAQECWKSYLIEFEELKEAFEFESPIDIILEGGDVIHAFIKWFLVKNLSKNILGRMWIWLLIFPLVLPCTIKLGRRYLNNGCIRNHKNKNNLDHIC